MSIRLILDPYDSGHRGQRMGMGPLTMAENGLAHRLGKVAGPVRTSMIEFEMDFAIEMATTFGVLREIAREAHEARQAGEFPLVVSGSCNSTAGALAAQETERLGLIWFDAHGDFHTPETTTSGFMGGLPLSIVVGHCWRAMAASIPGFEPLPEKNVIMVGLRDIDPGEEERFAKSDVQVLRVEEMLKQGIETSLASALEPLRGEIDSLYLHLDLDVCDPDSAPVNPYQPAGGLSPSQMRDCLRTLGSAYPIAGASVTAYDPDCDPARLGMSVAFELIDTLAEMGGDLGRASGNRGKSP